MTFLIDSFDRPDTTPGTLGNGWLLTGPSVTLTQVKDERYYVPPASGVNVYAYKTLPNDVVYMDVGVIWDGPNCMPIAFVSSDFPDEGFTNDLIHPIAGPTSVSLQKFVSGVPTTLVTRSMALATDGVTEHRFRWARSGDVVTVWYPGGVIVHQDVDFGIIVGETAYVQIRASGTPTDDTWVTYAAMADDLGDVDMPRTVIAPVVASATAGVLFTADAADTVNQNATPHTGREIIIARNSGVTERTVTITSAPLFGRLKDIAAETLAAGATKAFGPFPVAGWRQTDGTLYFQANHAEVLFTVVRLS